MSEGARAQDRAQRERHPAQGSGFPRKRSFVTSYCADNARVKARVQPGVHLRRRVDLLVVVSQHIRHDHPAPVHQPFDEPRRIRHPRGRLVRADLLRPQDLNPVCLRYRAGGQSLHGASLSVSEMFPGIGLRRKSAR